MEQLPGKHCGGPGQPQAGRGLCGRDFGLRRQDHQGPQGCPLRLQQLLQTHLQGQNGGMSLNLQNIELGILDVV